MAAKLNIGAWAAPAVVVVGLLLATCLLLAATAADASSRPLKVSPSSSSKGNDHGAQQTVQSPPAVGYVIETVVVGTVEQHGAGHRLMNVGMLAGIKPEGPSPGDGHH